MGKPVERCCAGIAAVLTAAAITCAAAAPLCARAQAVGPASSAASLPASLPLKKDVPSPETPVRAMLAWSLVLVIAAAGAGFVLLRSGRLGRGGVAWGRSPAGVLRRMTSLPLAQNASLHVIQWDSQEYLLGTTPQGVTLLDKRPVQQPAGTAAEGDGRE